MMDLLPFFGFIIIIIIILLVTGIVRPKLPEIIQPYFWGMAMILCVIVFFTMGISSIFTALKGAF